MVRESEQYIVHVLHSLRMPNQELLHESILAAQLLLFASGYGGPHAGFFAVKKELMKSLPGRIVGETK